MSKIYEALKKAEREKEAYQRREGVKSGLVESSAGSQTDLSWPHDVAAEEYSKMVNLLISANSDQDIRVLLILSSVNGEGTSSVCAQFARSLVQGKGEKVLLVDANLRRPVLHHLFALERSGGLVELLCGRIGADEVIKETQYSGLQVITAGTSTEDAPRLLGSARLKELLTEWKRNYNYVILDSAPALAYADAAILGRVVDGVVLVVHAGKTRREVIQKTLDTLSNIKAAVLGVVLNRRQFVIPRSVYRRL